MWHGDRNGGGSFNALLVIPTLMLSFIVVQHVRGFDDTMLSLHKHATPCMPYTQNADNPLPPSTAVDAITMSIKHVYRSLAMGINTCNCQSLAHMHSSKAQQR